MDGGTRHAVGRAHGGGTPTGRPATVSRTDAGAGEGNRTLTTSLEGWGSTIELHPLAPRNRRGRSCRLGAPKGSRLVSSANSPATRWTPELVGGAGFEPAKAEPPDLQSGPVGHFGIRPGMTYARFPPVPLPASRALERRPDRSGASDGTRTHNLQITNQVLYQLSYASRQLPRKGGRKIPTQPRSSRPPRGIFRRPGSPQRPRGCTSDGQSDASPPPPASAKRSRAPRGSRSQVRTRSAKRNRSNGLRSTARTIGSAASRRSTSAST
jgi:hypothetical protein